MGASINFILVAAGFLSVCAGIIFYRKRALLAVFVSAGVVLFVAPFVLHGFLTRDAFAWNIVVQRDLGDVANPRVIFVQRIEWITDYERLKRQRGHVGSLILNTETTEKVWHVKGYVPLEIRAEMLVGSDEIGVTRTFNELPPGEYTFTFRIDAANVGQWSIEPGLADGSR